MAEERSPVSVARAMADLATPMAIRVAATLHIAGHIDRGSSTAKQLAAASSADADALDRLLRHLTTVGIFSKDALGKYGLTTLGEALRDDHPNGLRGRLDIDGPLGRADLSYAQLLHSVRTGEPGYPQQFGTGFWEELSANSVLGSAFDKQMGWDVAAEAPDIVAAFDWGSLGDVVDVGGGNGTLLIALLAANPSLRGAVVDLPGPAATAGRSFAAAGLSIRAEAVAGSFFEPLPSGAGGYLLSAVLHNWDDAQASVILCRCAEAAETDGAVFAIERIRANGAVWSTARDLQGLAYFGGRERTLDQLTALAEDCGLRVDSVYPAGVNSVMRLVAFPRR